MPDTTNTYANCWEDNGISQPGTGEYSLYLAYGPDTLYGYFEVSPDSDNTTKFVVDGIPASIQPVAVAQKLRTITMWPMPARIDWKVAATLPPRALVRLRPEPSLAEQGPEWDETHYRALWLPDGRCLGWTA